MFFVDNIVCGADEMRRKNTEWTETCQYYVFCFGYADKDLNADLYRGIFEQIKRYQDFADKFKQKLLSDLSIGLYLKSACSYWIRKYDILLKTLKSIFLFQAGNFREYRTPRASCCRGFSSIVAEWSCVISIGKSYKKRERSSAVSDRICVFCEN